MNFQSLRSSVKIIVCGEARIETPVSLYSVTIAHASECWAPNAQQQLSW
jgi:hypothetical protein